MNENNTKQAYPLSLLKAKKYCIATTDPDKVSERNPLRVLAARVQYREHRAPRTSQTHLIMFCTLYVCSHSRRIITALPNGFNYDVINYSPPLRILCLCPSPGDQNTGSQDHIKQ